MLHALNKGRKYSYNWYKGSVGRLSVNCDDLCTGLAVN